MKRFPRCSYGIKDNNYKYLTCPAAACPWDNTPWVINHDKFYDYKEEDRGWPFDPFAYGFNCRIMIKADSSLNGKLNLEIKSTGD